jgi:hypothetical protein
LLVFLEAFCFVHFGDFIPKGENVRPKQARFQGYETKGGECEHRKRRSKRENVDVGGIWMMVRIQASVSGSHSVNFCKFMLALVVLS